MIRTLACLFGILLIAIAGTAHAEDYAEARRDMVAAVERQVAALAPITGVPTISESILGAMAEVPRHLFVPASVRQLAYQLGPVPVHPEQNLTDPVLTALMLQLAGLRPGDTVFETGTDTGYLADLLSHLVRSVKSVEVLPELAGLARHLLDQQGVKGVELRAGDGYYGWPEFAPYDAIIVKEGLDHIPSPLVRQLRDGGRMVLPLSDPQDGQQYLTVVTRMPEGRLSSRRVLPVQFTPMQGGDRI